MQAGMDRPELALPMLQAGSQLKAVQAQHAVHKQLGSALNTPQLAQMTANRNENCAPVAKE